MIAALNRAFQVSRYITTQSRPTMSAYIQKRPQFTLLCANDNHALIPHLHNFIIPRLSKSICHSRIYPHRGEDALLLLIVDCGIIIITARKCRKKRGRSIAHSRTHTGKAPCGNTQKAHSLCGKSRNARLTVPSITYRPLLSQTSGDVRSEEHTSELQSRPHI